MCWKFIRSPAVTLICSPVVLFSKGNIWLGGPPLRKYISKPPWTCQTCDALWTTASYAHLWAFFLTCLTWTLPVTHFLHFEEFILHCIKQMLLCSDSPRRLWCCVIPLYFLSLTSYLAKLLITAVDMSHHIISNPLRCPALLFFYAFSHVIHHLLLNTTLLLPLHPPTLPL